MSVFWGSLKCFNVSFTVIQQVCPTKSGWNLHCRFVCFKILLNTSETRIDALMLCYLLELDDLRPYVYLSLNYLTKSKETYMYRVLQNHYVPSTIWSINDIIKYFIPKWSSSKTEFISVVRAIIAYEKCNKKSKNYNIQARLDIKMLWNLQYRAYKRNIILFFRSYVTCRWIVVYIDLKWF
jgi:hypothetical protein